MPKITSVELQKKNPKRFNIFLDGEFAFGADEDLVVDKRLVPGKLLDISDVEQLLLEAEVGKIMERMYRFFNIRQRSEKEIRDYLKNLSFKRKVKGNEEISDLVINSVIDKLKRKSMINNEKFAKSWVESRSKKYGVNRIKQELYDKGIDRETIEEVLDGKISGNSEEVAQKLLEKRIERWRKLPPIEFKKKAYEYLLRRGFEYGIVKSIVEKFVKKY